MRHFFSSAATAVLLMGLTTAQAENYPSKNIQLMVPYTPGTGPDVVARTFANALQAQMGVSIIVENREGATGVIGSAATARSKADGYSLMVNAYIPFLTAPYVQKVTTYDPVKSFSPIAMIGSVPLVMITSAQSPVASLQQLKEYANANPSVANHATTGNGSPGQLYMEQIQKDVGMKLTEIPYKSSGQALTEVASGQVLVSIVSLPPAEALIQSGKLRLLAVGSKQRMKKYPDVPTLAEALGKPGFEATNWYGFLAPANTPPDRVTKLYDEIAKAYKSKPVIEVMERQNIILDLQSPSQFAAKIRNDAERTKRMLAPAMPK